MNMATYYSPSAKGLGTFSVTVSAASDTVSVTVPVASDTVSVTVPVASVTVSVAPPTASVINSPSMGRSGNNPPSPSSSPVNRLNTHSKNPPSEFSSSSSLGSE